MVCVKSPQSCPTLLQPYGLSLARLFCPGDSPGKNTGVGCSAFLQGIFLTQGSNLCFLCLLCWQQILYHKRHYPVTYRTFKCPQRPFYCLPFIRYTCFPPFFVTLFILISISVISPFHRCCLNAVIQYVTFGFFHSE